MQYNLRLRVVNKNNENDIRLFNLVQLSNSIGFGAFKSDYKVAQGNRTRGISQGLGLQNAGRSISVAIPIFQNKDFSVYDLVAEYTSIFANSFSFNFFLECNINNEWYSNEVLFNECKGYSATITTTLEGFGLSFIQLDNYFFGNMVEDILDYIDTSKKDVECKNKSQTPVSISFDWIVEGDGDLSCYIFSRNYGININYYFSKYGVYTIKYNGYNTTVIEEGKENLITKTSGLQPILNIGNNILTINSNLKTNELKIKYRKGINL